MEAEAGQEAKVMDINEFVEQGFLQEVNRQFFHPLGLALEVLIDDNGQASLSSIWDFRDDPEGIIFAPGGVMSDEDDIRKHANVAKLLKSKIQTRIDRFGWHIQPVHSKGQQ
jgi:hypothetical protein